MIAGNSWTTSPQMKHILLSIALLLLVVSAVSQPQKTEPLTLTISSESPEFKVGSPIIVNVTLENISDKPTTTLYSVGQGQAELIYDVDVLDGYGRRVARTDYGHALRGEASSHMIMSSFLRKEIKAHEQLTDTVDLTKIYDLNVPGTYLVQLTKKHRSKGGAKISSNALKITVER
jgi:hypothetical protein